MTHEERTGPQGEEPFQEYLTQQIAPALTQRARNIWSLVVAAQPEIVRLPVAVPT
jgi:hypothetical protein